MGWVDNEPYFSMIEDRKAELIEQGENPVSAWNMAYEECIDRIMQAAEEHDDE